MNVKSALVIDDSKSARFALRRHLESHRYQVEAVETPDEAMRFLATNRPGVIFLDHVMPGVEGFSVLRSLKDSAQTAAIPVVVCSSNEGTDFNAQACAAGATCVLQKPPQPDQLQRILDDLDRVGTSPPVASPAPAAVEVAPELAPANTVARAASFVPATVQTPAPAREATLLRSTGVDDSMREQLDTRMKRVSQGLFAQFAEIKATVAALASQQTRLAEQPASVSRELRTELDEASQALRLVTSRVEGIESEVFSQLTAMRTHLDSTLKAHGERVAELAQTARQVAAEEAQIVAERAVMAAALRISDQLADAILGAAGRR